MAAPISIKVDLREFNKALKEYVAESKMEIADAINKKAGDIAFRAAVNTPVAKGITVKDVGIPKGHPFWHAIATGKTKFGVSKKGAAVKGKGNKKIANAIFASRKRHISYSRALFLHIAAELGQKVKSIRKSSKIENAGGLKADRKGLTDKPRATLKIIGVESSHAPILQDALNDGIAWVIKDMAGYVGNKIAKRAKAKSGIKKG
jgi:hypothetical protein